MDDTLDHPPVSEVEPGHQGHVVDGDDAVVPDQDGRALAGDLLHAPDLVVVVKPGQLAQGLGSQVQPVHRVDLELTGAGRLTVFIYSNNFNLNVLFFPIR